MAFPNKNSEFPIIPIPKSSFLIPINLTGSGSNNYKIDESLYFQNSSDSDRIIIPTSRSFPGISISPPPQRFPVDKEALHAIFYYFTALFETVSIKLLIHRNQLDSVYLKLTQIISLIKEHQFLVQIFENFLSKLNCHLCHRRLSKVGLTCSHIFCIECLSNTLGNSYIPPTKFEKQLACPLCFSEINLPDLKSGFPDWEQRKEDCRKRERMQATNKLECKGCLRELEICCYKGCKCFCFECQLDNESLGICQCGEFQYDIVCDACKKRVKAPYLNKFAIFCDGHLHCRSCIKECCGEFKCLVCKGGLELFDIRKVFRYGYKTCKYCRNCYEVQYFPSENCCEDHCCVTCQVKVSSTYCCNCRVEFPVDLRSKLEGQNLLL